MSFDRVFKRDIGCLGQNTFSSKMRSGQGLFLHFEIWGLKLTAVVRANWYVILHFTIPEQL